MFAVYAAFVDLTKMQKHKPVQQTGKCQIRTGLVWWEGGALWWH